YRGDIFLPGMKGLMRRMGRQVGKARELISLTVSHPRHGLPEEYIGAVTFERCSLPIVDVYIIKIIITPIIGHRSNMRSGEPQGVLETPVFRPKWVIVAEVPLTAQRGLVSGR